MNEMQIIGYELSLMQMVADECIYMQMNLLSLT